MYTYVDVWCMLMCGRNQTKHYKVIIFPLKINKFKKNKVQCLTKRPFLPFHHLESLRSIPEAAQRVPYNILYCIWTNQAVKRIQHPCRRMCEQMSCLCLQIPLEQVISALLLPVGKLQYKDTNQMTAKNEWFSVCSFPQGNKIRKLSN